MLLKEWRSIIIEVNLLCWLKFRNLFTFVFGNLFIAGHILSLVRGKGGTTTAVYEVAYEDTDGEIEESCEVDHLVEDYFGGDLKLIH